MGVVKNFGNNFGVKRNREIKQCIFWKAVIYKYSFYSWPMRLPTSVPYAKYRGNSWGNFKICYAFIFAISINRSTSWYRISFLRDGELFKDGCVIFQLLPVKRISVNPSHLSLPCGNSWWPKRQSQKEKCGCFKPWKNSQGHRLSVGSKPQPLLVYRVMTLNISENSLPPYIVISMTQKADCCFIEYVSNVSKVASG